MAPRSVIVRCAACDAECASEAVQVFSSEPAKITDEDIDAIISKGESETVRLAYGSRFLVPAPALASAWRVHLYRRQGEHTVSRFAMCGHACRLICGAYELYCNMA